VPVSLCVQGAPFFAASASPLAAESFLTQLPGIQIDAGILDLLFPTDGDTSYEELKCIGLIRTILTRWSASSR
jgi:hypothetical protein